MPTPLQDREQKRSGSSTSRFRSRSRIEPRQANQSCNYPLPDEAAPDLVNVSSAKPEKSCLKQTSATSIELSEWQFISAKSPKLYSPTTKLSTCPSGLGLDSSITVSIRGLNGTHIVGPMDT